MCNAHCACICILYTDTVYTYSPTVLQLYILYNVKLYSRVAPSAWTHFSWAQDAPAMWKDASFSESERDNYLFESFY